ncbi:MAG: hypothetical protein AAGB19_03685 [Cyanobacteria bacterium P01_F01_bin.3]
MINISKRNGSSLKTTLYYVRLKTHDSVQLFEVRENAALDASKTFASQGPSLATIVSDELLQISNHHRDIEIEQWVLEPNALHALVSVEEHRHNPDAKGKPRSLTSFVAALKAATAKRINLIRNQPGSSVWQRSYNEQRVEDEMMLARLRKKLNESEHVVMAG